MTQTVGGVAIELSANAGKMAAEFKSGADMVDRQSRRMAGSISLVDRAFGGLNSSVKSFAGGAVAAFGFQQVMARAKSAASELDKIAKTARSSGLDAGFYQELKFAAESASIGQDKLSQALLRFNRSVGESNAGYGELAEKLRRLNPELLKQFQAAGNNEQRLRILADAVRQVAGDTNKAALASAAFGESGVEFVRILGRGAAGLDEFAARARKLGAVLSDETLAQAEQVADQIGTLSLAIDRQIDALFLNLTPAITTALEELNQFVREANEIVSRVKAGDWWSVLGITATFQKPGWFKALEDLNGSTGAPDAYAMALKNLNTELTNTPALAESAASTLDGLAGNLPAAVEQFLAAGRAVGLTAQEQQVLALGKVYDQLAGQIRNAGLSAQQQRAAIEQLNQSLAAQISKVLGLTDANQKLYGVQTEVIRGIRVTRPAGSDGALPGPSFQREQVRGVTVSRGLANGEIAAPARIDTDKVVAQLDNEQVRQAVRDGVEQAQTSVVSQLAEVHGATEQVVTATEQTADAFGKAVLPVGDKVVETTAAIKQLELSANKNAADILRGLGEMGRDIAAGLERGLRAARAAKDNTPGKAAGGLVSGPGGPTSDQVPVMLSNGEYVIRASAVRKLGTRALERINAGQLPGLAMGGSLASKIVGEYEGGALSPDEIAWRQAMMRMYTGSGVTSPFAWNFDKIATGYTSNTAYGMGLARLRGGGSGVARASAGPLQSSQAQYLNRQYQANMTLGREDAAAKYLDQLVKLEDKLVRLAERQGTSYQRLVDLSETIAEASEIRAEDRRSIEAIDQGRIGGASAAPAINIQVDGFAGDQSSARQLAAQIAQQVMFGLARA